MIGNVIKSSIIFSIEKQCAILRTEGHQFRQDNRDELEVSGKHCNRLQRSTTCKVITKHVIYYG